MNLDDKDRRIISMFAEDPAVSQETVARELGISQPSVAVRIRKLREGGALESINGINPLKMGLYLAKVDISSNQPGQILDMFRDCPYFANGFTISGHNNLCLMFASENISTLEAIVNGHIRSNKWVTAVDFNIMIGSERPFIVPTRLVMPKVDESPCGNPFGCRDCKAFKEMKCMGCPATGQYQGNFFITIEPERPSGRR